MRSLTEFVLLFWVGLSITYIPTDGDEVRQLVGNISFGATFILYLITFYYRQESTGTRSIDANE